MEQQKQNQQISEVLGETSDDQAALRTTRSLVVRNEFVKTP